jgi:hypothetical protein
MKKKSKAEQRITMGFSVMGSLSPERPIFWTEVLYTVVLCTFRFHMLVYNQLQVKNIQKIKVASLLNIYRLFYLLFTKQYSITTIYITCTLYFVL